MQKFSNAARDVPEQLRRLTITHHHQPSLLLTRLTTTIARVPSVSRQERLSFRCAMKKGSLSAKGFSARFGVLSIVSGVPILRKSTILDARSSIRYIYDVGTVGILRESYMAIELVHLHRTDTVTYDYLDPLIWRRMTVMRVSLASTQLSKGLCHTQNYPTFNYRSSENVLLFAVTSKMLRVF